MSTKKTTFFTNLSINSKVMMHFTQNVLNFLPWRVRDEIVRLCDLYGGIGSLSELRLRATSRGAITVGGKRLPLAAEISESELSELLTRMCRGSLYAYRDRIAEGYITLGGGVRVGICGRARYDGGALVGISDITAMTVRVPTDEFFDTEALYSAWRGSRGLLIYSPPGVGKTTALRSLVSKIAAGVDTQVVIVDEREEIPTEPYRALSVDILRGYKRCEGMQIALRNLSPDIIAVDEIGRREEAEAMLDSLNSGVGIIATAHAATLAEVMKRKSLAPFFENGVFDTLVGISISRGVRSLSVERING